MKVDKMSISLDVALGDQVREAAQKTGLGLSSWLATAARAKLRAESLAEFLENWENENGPLTPDEIAAAERDFDGLPQTSS